ncbi:hypothetical protein [Kribbella solani]|uniref:hypothetical protein n=1 Tax=Kribbella solani TaxID=236067 RepID=UPI0029AF8083|nr:hypothetical protein [Kribbella solani]MDX2968595.1 hypothetical protein [Kribbella solani]
MPPDTADASGKVKTSWIRRSESNATRTSSNLFHAVTVWTITRTVRSGEIVRQAAAPGSTATSDRTAVDTDPPE